MRAPAWVAVVGLGIACGLGIAHARRADAPPTPTRPPGLPQWEATAASRTEYSANLAGAAEVRQAVTAAGFDVTWGVR